MDDGLDLLRGTAFQHHAPEFVTVYVVPVPTVDEVTPFLAGSQIVHNQNTSMPASLSRQIMALPMKPAPPVTMYMVTP